MPAEKHTHPLKCSQLTSLALSRYPLSWHAELKYEKKNQIFSHKLNTTLKYLGAVPTTHRVTTMRYKKSLY